MQHAPVQQWPTLDSFSSRCRPYWGKKQKFTHILVCRFSLKAPVDTWWEAHTDETGAKILRSEQNLRLEIFYECDPPHVFISKWAIKIIGEVLVTWATES